MSEALFVLGSGQFTVPDGELMKLLFLHSLESNASQSNIYSDTVVSMQAILANHKADSQSLQTHLIDMYTAYYSRYFNDVRVDFYGDNTDEAKVDYTFSVEGYRNNHLYSLAYSLQSDYKTMAILSSNQIG